MISIHDVMKYLLCNCSCRISVKDPHRRDTPPETTQEVKQYPPLDLGRFELPKDSFEQFITELRRHRRASV